MFVSVYFANYLLRGELLDDEESDFGEVDTMLHGLEDEMRGLQPNRDPVAILDYLGSSGEVEIIVKFKTNWQDREVDREYFVDDIQGVIENGLNCIINDREFLGFQSP